MEYLILLALCALSTAFLAPAQRMAKVSSPRTISMEIPERLSEFLKDAERLGNCRFVVQGSGAILESIGTFTDMRASANPKTGKDLITFSNNAIAGFECHLRVDEIVKYVYRGVYYPLIMHLHPLKRATNASN